MKGASVFSGDGPGGPSRFFQQGGEAFRVAIQDQLLQSGEIFLVAGEDLRHRRISREEAGVQLGAEAEDLLDDRLLRPEDGCGEGVECRRLPPRNPGASAP